MADDRDIHIQLGQIIEAVGTLKDSFDKVSGETSALAKNSIKLTDIVDRMEPVLAGHEKIARSIKPEYLGRLDDHHAYIEMCIRKASFWKSVREQMIRKGAMFAMLCILAGALYYLGFESIAQKLMGL